MTSLLETWILDSCPSGHGSICKRKWTNCWIDHEIWCCCSCHRHDKEIPRNE
ncbi:MAG: hypothetical protein ACPKPY_02190 [Nitrososphaeraceae archaeon]